MPTIYYQVESAGTEILKTVADEVTYGILADLDLTQSFEGAVYPMSSFQAISDFSNGNGQPKLKTNRCDVSATYVMDKSQVPWPNDSPYTTTALGRRASQVGKYTAILADGDAGILMEHQTVACAIELSFSLFFTTFDEASKAFDRIQTRYKSGLIQNPFYLYFSYPVTVEMWKFLFEVFTRKRDYVGKKFMDWINDVKIADITWDVRKSEITEEDADKALMIRSRQPNCLMQLTMDQREPEVYRTEQLPEGYIINFTSVVQFGRPTVVSVSTPVTVDNSALPANLFTSIGAESHYSPHAVGVFQDRTISELMRRGYGNFNFAHQLVRIPEYDDWLQVDSQYVLYQYRPFMIINFTLDGPTTEIDLNQLGDVSLHAVTKKIMQETGSDILRYGGLFNIGVYANDLRMTGELVTIDENLKLTIKSNRLDKVYHLVISETTELTRTDPKWDALLVKYRYFFPMTIERNLESLIQKQYFKVDYSNGMIALIAKLSLKGKVKALLQKLVDLGEVNYEIFAYTQNKSQLADYLALTQSMRTDYAVPTGTDDISKNVRKFYSGYASVEGRSLLIAFLELCIIDGHVSVDNLPTQYLNPNSDIYPYYGGQGGFYGYNTPLRVIHTNIAT